MSPLLVKRPRKRLADELAERIQSLLDSRAELRMNEEILTTYEAARLTKLSMAWFERKRWMGEGPPFRRRGRNVRYLKSELLTWWIEVRGTDFREAEPAGDFTDPS